MLDHKGTKTINTSRLILRKFVASDAVPMFRNWASDPEVTRYLTWPAHENAYISQKIVDLWVSDYDKPDFYQWAIVLKEINEPIGSISVVAKDDSVPWVEIGYCIGKRWWHQGIVSEALQAVIEFFFREVGVVRIQAKHNVNNPNSGAVMKKCGMTLEGTLRSAYRDNQGLCDLCQYAIIKED